MRWHTAAGSAARIRAARCVRRRCMGIWTRKKPMELLMRASFWLKYPCDLSTGTAAQPAGVAAVCATARGVAEDGPTAQVERAMNDEGFGKGSHLYLIDGSAFIFRAFHALPPLTRKSD